MDANQLQARLVLLKCKLRKKKLELKKTVYREKIEEEIEDIKHVISFVRLQFYSI